MTYQMTDKEVNDLMNMIGKLVTKRQNANAFVGDRQDIESELLINALEIIEKRQEVDFNYLYVASSNRLVDIVRKSVRQDHVSIDVSCFERFDDNESKSEDERRVEDFITSVKFDGYDDPIENVELQEILHLFPEGSQEYEVVKAHFELAGLIEGGPNLDQVKRIDKYIATEILGYKSSSSMGYIRVRGNVRNAIHKYLYE